MRKIKRIGLSEYSCSLCRGVKAATEFRLVAKGAYAGSWCYQCEREYNRAKAYKYSRRKRSETKIYAEATEEELRAIERRCGRCGESKVLADFKKDKHKPYGRGYGCKRCKNEKAKMRSQAKRREVIPRKRESRAMSIEEKRRRVRIAKAKWWATLTVEQRREQRQKYQTKNKKSYKKTRVPKSEWTPLKRVQVRVVNALRVAFNRIGINTSLTKHRVFEFLGYHAEDLRNHLGQWIGKPCMDCNGVEVLTLNNAHIDHIEPKVLAKTEEDIRRLNQLSNLRLICKICNLRKHARHVDVRVPLPQRQIELEGLRRERAKERKREYRRLPPAKSVSHFPAIVIRVRGTTTVWQWVPIGK